MKKVCILGICLCILVSLNANPIELNAEYGDKFEGDIVLTPEEESESGRNARTGIRNTNLRWPKINGLVTIPYVIEGYTSSERNTIINGMNEIAAKTCVRFVPRSSQSDYLRIFSGDGCWSFVGRIGGRQDLSLKRNGCVYFGIAMHELLHAIGFGHMHQHWDRGSKVYINFNNISPSYRIWFNTLDRNSYNDYGTGYDISSVMHYGPTAFTSNGQVTIQAYNSADQRVMGQRSYLSSGDVARVKNMYQC